MIKTIFGKIMLLFMAIIMIALVLSGLMMSQVIRSAYLDESQQQMLSVAEDIKTQVKYYANNFIPIDQVTDQMKAKAIANGYAIWVVDSGGTPWLINDPSGKTVVTQEDIQKYYDSMVQKLNEGYDVRAITEEANVFNTPVLTVASPVLLSDNIAGYVFIHKQLYEMDQSLMAMYRQIILAACISAGLGMILTYIFSRSMLRPLGVVTLGAKQLAKGDFDIHLQVSSKDEIGQLADTFNSVAKDLKKYEAARESLVANVSHELRSPLTSVQGLVQGITDGTIPAEDSKHYLDVVLDETKRLSLLINEMLDLSRIESGQFPMEMQKIDLNEQILRVLLSFESKITAKNVDVQLALTEQKVYILADENRLIQVLHNIIENAIKFVGEGGMLKIATEIQKETVLVHITNSGDVIPKEDLPYLFDRFYKIDKSHSREKEGTGLGLSIVKNILKAHGQKIWVTSNKKDGTTFTFTLKKV